MPSANLHLAFLQGKPKGQKGAVKDGRQDRPIRTGRVVRIDPKAIFAAKNRAHKSQELLHQSRLRSHSKLQASGSGREVRIDPKAIFAAKNRAYEKQELLKQPDALPNSLSKGSPCAPSSVNETVGVNADIFGMNARKKRIELHATKTDKENVAPSIAPKSLPLRNQPSHPPNLVSSPRPAPQNCHQEPPKLVQPLLSDGQSPSRSSGSGSSDGPLTTPISSPAHHALSSSAQSPSVVKGTKVKVVPPQWTLLAHKKVDCDVSQCRGCARDMERRIRTILGREWMKDANLRDHSDLYPDLDNLLYHRS